MTDYPFDYDFRGQVAVITGAARGFGFAFARSLGQLGATVVLGDVDANAGSAAAATLRGESINAHFRPLDVRASADAEAVAKFAFDLGGRLDLWINNAGIARHGPSETLTSELWSLPVEIMLSGTFYGAQAAARLMLPQRRGAIINIASVNGFIAQAGRASYASAKAGVIRLTEVLAAEWAGQGVRVNGIAPGVFMTDLARTSLADGSASLDTYLKRAPSGRFGELPELLAVMLFLASSHSSYIVGQTLKVDGAWAADRYL